MTKEELTKELKKLNIKFTKIKFYEKSPYQSKRYKPKFVGWEAWVYNGNSDCGVLITQDDWEGKDYKQTLHYMF